MNIPNLKLKFFNFFERLSLFLKKVYIFAYLEVKSKYVRNYLGPFWVVLSMAFSSLGLGLMWTILFNTEPSETIPFVTTGFLLWIVTTGIVQESTQIFTGNSSSIRCININILFFPSVLVAKHSINFIHYSIILIGLKFYLWNLNLVSTLLFFGGLIYLFLSLFFLSVIIGFVSARFRDIEAFINSIIPMLFFISPVLLKNKVLGDYSFLLWLNPFSYLIWFVRDPFLNHPINIEMYITGLGLLLFYFLIFIFIQLNNIRRVIFWI